MLCILAIPAVLLAASSTDEQIAAIQRRLERAPADNMLRDQLAGAYLQKMRETADGSYLERAAKLVTAVLESNPSSYGARRRQLEIEMHRHRFQAVVRRADALSKERPEDAAVLGLLGDALMELGEYDRAADVYQKMADLRPGLASYNRVAFYRFVIGDAEGAIDIMRRAVRIGAADRENVAWCLAELGNMLFKTGAGSDAEQAFRQALSLFPGYHHALAGLGRLLASRGDDREAIRLLLQAQSKAPFPEYAGSLARLYRKTGRPDLAKKQIALLDVTDTLDRAAGETANRNLALAYADLEHRTGRALELARAELLIRRDVYTYDALAWAFFRNGKFVEAEAAIKKALAHNTPEPSFREHAEKISAALKQAATQRNKSAFIGVHLRPASY
jgi:tetratricopeptide (TPR) repeat protein